MAQIIGQVYNPTYLAPKKEGEKEKSSQFQFSLGSRKARANEDSSKVFTRSIAFGFVADKLNEFFGNEEHHGKWIALYGHFDEYEWTPDDNNPDHDKLLVSKTLTKDLLTQAGFKFAEGSANEVTIQFHVPQKARQFVVNGFEFVGDHEGGTSSTPKKSTGSIRIAGGSVPAVGETSSEASKADTPF